MIDYKYLNNFYKPNKIIKNKKSVIISSQEGDFLVKEKKSDIASLYNYLSSRDYDYYPNLVNNDNNCNVYKYISEDNIPINQKLNELATHVGLLHNKTVYFKTISLDKIKEVRDIVLSNINYLDDYYEKIFIDFIKDEYSSPTQYLFLRNYFKIKRMINFCKNELDNWYLTNEKLDKIRICLNHNNLSLNHYLCTNKGILTNWDKYTFDSPIIDIISLYKKECLNIDFKIFFDRYLEVFPLNEYELKLFFIIISLPYEIKLNIKEMNNIKLIKELFNYLDKTEKLIRPYYTSEENKE